MALTVARAITTLRKTIQGNADTYRDTTLEAKLRQRAFKPVVTRLKTIAETPSVDLQQATVVDIAQLNDGWREVIGLVEDSAPEIQQLATQGLAHLCETIVSGVFVPPQQVSDGEVSRQEAINDLTTLEQNADAQTKPKIEAALGILQGTTSTPKDAQGTPGTAIPTETIQGLAPVVAAQQGHLGVEHTAPSVVTNADGLTLTAQEAEDHGIPPELPPQPPEHPVPPPPPLLAQKNHLEKKQNPMP